ncbi:MAG: hypothetical protein H0V89_03875 [Deltaproteobacteria bacterium]|nr:hypothetical protein [Deltaproteobacteria bacterium]
MAWFAQHRVWLRPRFLITDDVSMTVEVRALDGVAFGDQPTAYVNPVESAPPGYDTRALTAPTSTTEPATSLGDITLWRAWGEANTPIGRFSFGRMPLHWGAGVWLNDGLCDTCDFGDTTDRIRWEYLVQEQIWVSAAVDVDAEGFLAEADDTTSYDLAFAYRNEAVETGLWASWSRTPVREFNLVTLDATFDAQMGNIGAAAEVIGQLGGGNLEEGVNDVSIAAFGAVVDLSLDARPWGVRLQAGLATGDGDDRDNRLRTFTFDRDYSVGVALFEQPMPTLAAGVANEANGGRSTELALTGEAISNAMFLKPTLSREIIGGLSVEQSFLGARVAKVPESFGPRRSYGIELDTTLRYTGLEHFDAAGTFVVFLPGSYYRDYVDATRDGFSGTVFGGQLQLRVDF